MSRRILFVCAATVMWSAWSATAQDLSGEIDGRSAAVMPKVIQWRRDFHQHPELGNREVRTSQAIAEYLRSLGLEVRTGVAKTGIVAVLRGGTPGPVVALRSDMDALPVTEASDLPFKSVARSTYDGQDVGVMHACGHDAHMAMLMGAAEVLTALKAQIPGTVKFIFQPAEEGPPPGETGGAGDMVKEGALENPKVDAIFGLHVLPLDTGTLWYRAGGLMASSDRMSILVRGRQTHGAAPWGGVDPIVVSAQIVTALQTIVSRQIDLTKAPVVVTVGRINGGVRYNIIPDTVTMEGTVRTLDPATQSDIRARIKRAVELVAQSAGATAEVTFENTAPVVFNDRGLTETMSATLARVSGGKLFEAQPRTIAEDFSKFQQQVPGMFYYLGINRPGQDLATVAENHSPYFYVDESALVTGVKAHVSLALDFLTRRAGGR